MVLFSSYFQSHQMALKIGALKIGVDSSQWLPDGAVILQNRTISMRTAAMARRWPNFFQKCAPTGNNCRLKTGIMLDQDRLLISPWLA
jgi:hypothetical protein